MPLYFYLHDATAFQDQLAPALAASWRQRSFEPCQALSSALAPAIWAFAERYHCVPEDSILVRLRDGLPFDRAIWRFLVGEVLLYGACAVPEIQTAPETLCCLLAPGGRGETEVPRTQFAPIQQVHFGSRDLVFGGGFYRPDQAGWNDRADVVRLAEYLQAVDPRQWTPATLACLAELADEEDRAEELEFAREWFRVLCDLYRAARDQDHVVICEIMEPSHCD